MPNPDPVTNVEYFLNQILSTLGGSLSTSISSGTDVTVAIAGAAQRCGALAAVTRGILVTASPGNAGNVYLGDSTVTKGDGTKRGVTLVPGGSVLMAVSNANLIYVNADDNGSKVGIIAL